MLALCGVASRNTRKGFDMLREAACGGAIRGAQQVVVMAGLGSKQKRYFHATRIDR